MIQDLIKKIKKSHVRRVLRLRRIYHQNRKAMKKLLEDYEKIPKVQKQFPKSIAIIFQGTQNYIKFFPNYYRNLEKYFLPNTKKTYFVLTDQVDYEFLKSKKNIVIVPMPHSNYVMLNAYKYMDKAGKEMLKHDYIIWVDADMYLKDPVTEEEFFNHSKPIFGYRHPSYLTRVGTFEKNPESLAYVAPNEDKSTYIQACFWGGQSQEALKLVKELKKRIEKDLKNGIIARLEDESHLNKYRIENPGLFHIYPPNYAYPKVIPLPKPFKVKIYHDKFKKFKITGDVPEPPPIDS